MQERLVHVERVPEHHAIQHQAERVELVFLAFSITLPYLPALAVAQLARPFVSTLGPIKLSEDAAPVTFVSNVVQQVQCFWNLAQL